MESSEGQAPLLGEVTLEAGLGEGAFETPVELTLDTNHSGSVDSWSSSYYTFKTPLDSAGSYVVRFEQDAELRTTDLDLLGDDSGIYPRCNERVCEFGGLDSDTRYVFRVYGSESLPEHYSVRVTRGHLKGSEEEPVPLALDTNEAVHVEHLGASYYTFTTRSSGPYQLVYSQVEGAALDISIYSDSDRSSFFGWRCTSGICSTRPLDGNTAYILRVGEGASAKYEMTLERAPYGDGSATDPIPLQIGDSRASVKRSFVDHYYSFTTGPTPPRMLASQFLSELGVVWTDLTPEPTKVCRSSVCIYTDLQPNTKYDISVNQGSEGPARMRLIDLDPLGGCDAHAAHCQDFEGVAPSPAEPVYSAEPWSLASGIAATGASSFVSGSVLGERSCFSYPVPGVTSLLTLSVRGGAELSSHVTVDTAEGVTDSVLLPLVPNEWTRMIVSADRVENQTWIVCYREASGGKGNQIWIDDLQFE